MFHMIYFLVFMVTYNSYINRFVLQELGDITEGVRLVDNWIMHLGINATNFLLISVLIFLIIA
jgi:hypothetical protein